MRTFALIFIACLFRCSAFAQHYTEVFFPEMEFANKLDTLSYTEFSATLEINESDFAQPLYTFGSDNPEDWELITEAYEKYPEIVKPRINQTDLDGDGNPDVILSFLGGNEYSFTGLYLRTKKGYLNVLCKGGEFFGKYSNGNICIRRPACCDDPTNEYFRYELSNDGTVSCLDSLSVSTWRVRNVFTDEELFGNGVWEVSTDTLYAYRNQGKRECFDFYLPGAKVRLIRKEEVEGEQLMFCEIIGELNPEREYHHIFGHAFVWLAMKE